MRYVAPTSVAEAAALLEDGGVALAGGTWVVPALRGDELVVDLRRAGLDRLEPGHVGAMCTYSDLIAADVPLLSDMARGITGGWAIRGQGTIGGSWMAARPQSDVPACLVALGAEPVFEGRLLVGFDLPPAAARYGYYKLKRGASSWPIATAAAVVTDERRTVTLGGVTPTPVTFDAGDEIAVESFDDELAPASYREAVAPVVARRALERCG